MLVYATINNQIERLVSTFDGLTLTWPSLIMTSRLFHSRKRWQIEGLDKGKIHNLAIISIFQLRIR